MPAAQKSPLTKEEIENFKEQLLEKRGILLGSVESLAKDAMESTEATEHSKSPLNIADNASDAFEQDFAFLSMESEEDLIRKVDVALQAVEDGSYGICTDCELAIPTERLEFVPWATLCVSCQKNEEQHGPKNRDDDEFEVLDDDTDYNPAGDDRD